MVDFDSLEINVFSAAEPSRDLDEVRVLLAACDLDLEGDIRWFAAARGDHGLAGCAGLAGNTIKCVAVAAQYRGGNLSARLLEEAENLALRQGHAHLFLYTRPVNIPLFRKCGFYPLAQWDTVAALMENTPVGISHYCQNLARHYRPGERIGAVVMNANPFTLGHAYLAERAAAASDWLHIFVVREDASLFPYAERLEMVQRGVAHLDNVTVHPGSEYLISRATFPHYFLRDSHLVGQTHSAIDLLIFRNYLAPALGITQRFVGTEPYCPVTGQYNRDMRIWLEQPSRSPSPPIRVVEIPRKCQASGWAISASRVRALLKEGRLSSVGEIVPPSTLEFLTAFQRPECA
ncbi:[citrate (pro-3S)-lyase] ligase [Martelella alba]|uniref:[Citrate [pro-3S]-lyase] ligase n=2 Tax=Martelella alba TaxID=2590451 RepID=A0ABY2SLK4_9HYPH|nr:[citrate (pro-3S)-lyase] ligase [Martelella alba]